MKKHKKIYTRIALLSIFVSCLFYKQIYHSYTDFLFYTKNYFSLKKVNIYGNHISDKTEILNKINIGENIFSISLKNLKQSILQSSNKINNLELRIEYPDSLHIKIIDKEPFAIWWDTKGENHKIIDKHGSTIISNVIDIKSYKDLLIIVGKNAYREAEKVFLITQKYQTYKNANAAHFIGDRRWDIYLENDIVIKLPQLEKLNVIEITEKILNNSKYYNRISNLDMRLYPKRIFIKLKKSYAKI